MKDPLFAGTAIRTVSGRYVDVFNPDPETIDIEDIAHALSHQPRFGGHLRHGYSVGLHSLWCSTMVKEGYELDALLHDASEAYLTDVPSPIKQMLPEYKKVEDSLMKVIAEKFGFQFPFAPEVKEVDGEALEYEWGALMLSGENHYLRPALVAERFMERYHDLAVKQEA